MIDKKEAEKRGIATADGGARLAADKAALQQQIKALLPNLVNSDGQVDAKALQDVVDIANSRSNDQGYELTFAGKGLARAQADTPTDYELRAELEQSKDFHNTKNVVIRGDNIEVLKILYQNYFGKIKMIYIDPPYNTQSDEFVYKDNFKQSEAELIDKFGMGDETTDFLHNVYGTRSHSGWLAFMYPRLKLARELLREDGVIFISIDDNEQANLKLICDEIFGEENLVACLHVQMSATQGMKVASALKGNIVKNAEYILMYAKNKQEISLASLYEKREWDTHYSIYYDKDTGLKCSLLDFLKQEKEQANIDDDFNLTDIGGHYAYNDQFRKFIHSMSDNVWRDHMCDINIDLSPEQEALINNGEIIQYKSEERVYFLKKTCTGVIRQLLPLSLAIGETDDFEPAYGLRKIRGDWWIDYYKDMSNINSEGGIVYKNGKKPTRLIKDLAKVSAGCDDIVMDFFAGSGTTGESVMRLNQEDGGSRKFILVQWDEKIDEKKSEQSYKFCQDNKLAPVISSITIERLNRAGDKIVKDGGASSLDIGYKVYSIAPKPKLAKTTKKGETQLAMNVTRGEAINTLANMLCATCKPLDTPIETLIENLLYKADNEIYLLGKVPREALQEHDGSKINLDGWADINLSQFLTLGFHEEDQKETLTIVY